MPQYWVVGASWGGREDQYEIFIREGHWILGWEEDEQPSQTKRRDRIRVGDRIAIKKRNKSDIVIRAVGIVTGIDPGDLRVYVRWLLSDLHLQVPSRGCFASIHGPFSPDEEWTQKVFHIDQLERILVEDDEPNLLGHEGAERWRLHRAKERNRSNVKRKKAQVLRDTGSLKCEACSFDFRNFYGELGVDFCEVHHTIPLSDVDGPVRTKLDELAIVCSNCHRMIHKTDPMLSIPDFRARHLRRFKAD